MLEYDTLYQDLFICPFCRGNLRESEGAVTCQVCGERYPRLNGHQIDLRLRRPKTVKIGLELSIEMPQNGLNFVPLDINPDPEIDYSSYPVPSHLSEELISHFPAPKNGSSLVLDIGCGAAVHKELLETIGFTWVGMDYFNRDAPYLGDIQALPFRDDKFDFVITIAMIHEISLPFVALEEVFRVLKPGGKLIGTAPFLVPYYNTTYCHFTHMGLYSLLRSLNFQVERICPNRDWDGLKAISSMALFPKLPNPIARWIVAPLGLLHRMWWALGHLINRDDASNEFARIRRISGETDFVAVKPVE